MSMILCSVFALLAVILSSITAIFAVLSYCKVVGMEKSTHQIQYMHVEDQIQQQVDDELAERDKEGLYTSPERKERMREEKLLENFNRLYNQED